LLIADPQNLGEITNPCKFFTAPMTARFFLESTKTLLDRDLFYIPLRAGSLVQDVVGLGVQRVDQTARLAAAQAGLGPAHQFSSVPIQLIDFAVSVAGVNIFRGHLKGPRRAYAGDGLLEVQIGVIHLNAEVAPVGDVHKILLCVHSDAVHRVELIRARPARPDRFYPGTVLAELDDAGVVIAIRHEDIVLRIDRKSTRLK